MNLIFKRYRGFLLFMLVYWVICFFMLTRNISLLYVMLAWNILLATLPLFFINFSLLQNKQKNNVGTILFGILWLIFFPNSVYMITDFIHISNDKLIWYKEVARYSADNGTMYSNDIMQWLKLLVIGIGVIYGLLIGLESLNILYRFLNSKISKPISWLIITVVSLISGFGVYIGRFLRLNSWDLLMPVTLLNVIVSNINRFTIKFTLAFAGFIVIIFILYTLFLNDTAINLEHE